MNYHFAIESPRGVRVTTVRFIGTADGWTSEEDARLIAAAPELLEALRHMGWCQSCADGSWDDCEGGRAALAAIAKATENK